MNYQSRIIASVVVKTGDDQGLWKREVLQSMPCTLRQMASFFERKGPRHSLIHTKESILSSIQQSQEVAL